MPLLCLIKSILKILRIRERKEKLNENRISTLLNTKMKGARSSDAVCCSSERNVRGDQKFWVDAAGILKETLKGKNRSSGLCLDSGKESEVLCCVKQ